MKHADQWVSNGICKRKVLENWMNDEYYRSGPQAILRCYYAVIRVSMYRKVFWMPK